MAPWSGRAFRCRCRSHRRTSVTSTTSADSIAVVDVERREDDVLVLDQVDAPAVFRQARPTRYRCSSVARAAKESMAAAIAARPATKASAKATVCAQHGAGPSELLVRVGEQILRCVSLLGTRATTEASSVPGERSGAARETARHAEAPAATALPRLGGDTRGRTPARTAATRRERMVRTTRFARTPSDRDVADLLDVIPGKAAKPTPSRGSPVRATSHVGATVRDRSVR